ncbi:MAG: phosphonate metabolism protein/1,5-bisphosphokinase (PRPP-forming) PhnN [Rhodobacterales bacterium]|nr:MAG: phosphonate metabolism protein/1,5-bisphosphokinase (PRPP-forming) PhnN [Rhodobacterales bacterium]
MTAGRLIAVVGPSGVGKDSVMDGLLSALPDLRRARRVITRAPELGGEDYDHMSVDVFEAAADEGAFCLHWGAHGLRYGIPAGVLRDVQDGAEVLANFSRAMLAPAAEIFPALTVLNLTARPETLAVRLSARGRETAEEIAARLARTAPLPDGLAIVSVSNDGALEDTISAARAALYPERA